jgi:hypothetical protein
MSYKKLWNHIRENKINKLIFIHTPKCGGTYASKILADLKIINKSHFPVHAKNHIPANENENGITFTIIRDPIERFESLLNFRLSMKPLDDWPKHLYYVYDDINITLNEIVDKMSDNEILGFTPFKSLVYWTKNVDIIITIDQLQEFLNFFGYFYIVDDYKKENVSPKLRGKFTDEIKERIRKLYYDDILLYDKISKNKRINDL